MKFCSVCGKKISDGSNFCSHCGAAIDGENRKEASKKLKESKNSISWSWKKWGCVIIVLAFTICIIVLIKKDWDENNISDMPESNIESNIQVNYVEEMDEEDNSIVSDELTVENPNTDLVDEEGLIEIEQFVKDSDELSLNGNTEANLDNWGWVTEQGDWNYYGMSFPEMNKYYILKENLVTGEKYKIYEEASDIAIKNLHISGEWLYFTRGDDIARIRTDGDYFQILELDIEQKIIEWDIYNNRLYAIIGERTGASKFEYCIVIVDWENNVYQKLNDWKGSRDNSAYNFDIAGSNWCYMGIEDGYIFLNQQYTDEIDDTETNFIKIRRISLENPNDIAIVEYQQKVGNLMMFPYTPSNFYIKDSNVIGFPYDYNFKSDDFFYTVTDFEQGSLNLCIIPELNMYRGQIYGRGSVQFNDQNILWAMRDYGLVSFNASGESYIVEEEIKDYFAITVCIAHNNIYYFSPMSTPRIYGYIGIDGSWHEMKIEDFISINDNFNN